MITFLSLFFGLISGPCPIELTVNGPVASVEILVDGKSTGKIQGPPWKTDVDFGKDLLPHDVVARALDAAGHEIARAQEWINLPHPLKKAEVVLEGEKGGPPRAARVVWTNLRGETPLAFTLSFDGQPVTLDASGRGVLPSHDLKTLHVLTAEVQFSSQEVARKEIAYGGEFGSAISTELTALPVRVRRGKLEGPEQLGGWFTAGGQPVAVTAVEEGPAQLFVVRAPLAREMKGTLGFKGFGAGTSRKLGLGKDQRIRIVFPYALRFDSNAGMTDLFEISPAFTLQQVGFPLLLEDVERQSLIGGADQQEEARPRVRIADAVAVAGLEATAENRRRAVLLIISGREVDTSDYDPATVRRYLAALHVPLFVWCLNQPPPGSPLTAWGECQDVTVSRILAHGIDGIRDELDSQRIVLVDGRYLPQSLALSPAAAGVDIP